MNEIKNSPDEAIRKLIHGNDKYINSIKNNADISVRQRAHTAENGQHPYAVILTCSDSRVPPEHIFSAGIGDLFVVRTAGNVVSDFELGSIEYGALHLEAKVIVVMGHSGCGAVAAALGGHAEGNIVSIVNEIHTAIGETADPSEAENINIAHSYNIILESGIIKKLTDSKDLIVIQSKYDIHTGKVEFFS